MVEEDRVHHLARRRRQSEADVGNAEHGLDVRDVFLHQAYAFDGLHRAADVVDVAGGAGEDQRIDDDVLRGNAVLFGQQLYDALRHGQLALAREGLRLQLVFVDGAHHQRRAVAFGDRADALELLLAVLQVDRVDDALALAVGERQFHRLGVGGVDHDGRFDLADQLLVEGRDVLDLVAIGALQADVDDVRAVAYLAARDLGGLFPFLRGHQILEEARADHVGALAHDQRAIALLGLHQFDAGIVGAMRARGQRARALALGSSARWRECAPAWCRSSRRRYSASRGWRTFRAARRATPASRRTSLRSSAGRHSDSRRCGATTSR